MKKRYIIPIVSALASVGVGYYLKNKNEGTTSNNTAVGPVVNGGIPDQVDNFDHAQFENSKMVSEGSQYGVQYFNEMAEDEANEIFERLTE